MGFDRGQLAVADRGIGREVIDHHMFIDRGSARGPRFRPLRRWIGRRHGDRSSRRKGLARKASRARSLGVAMQMKITAAKFRPSIMSPIFTVSGSVPDLGREPINLPGSRLLGSAMLR
jgi:hypothetical protein